MSRVVEVAPERYAAWRERFDVANPDGPQRVVGISRFEHPHLAVLLIRRGGYAVAHVEGSTLVLHKVGTRHVQSRTAAGGWSQQRFARRRGNQADELVRAVTEHFLRIVPAGIPQGVVVGGDKTLVREVLEDPRLEFLADLPRREFHDIGDPRRAVLDEVVRRARAVEVRIDDGP
ncbi:MULTISPECIES: acVLRF1 family peptidyl-tRNA hydrolase [unclassified Knoellia]|uniref:acVLRF1 family peptidyl-tRNA hydrolase n=1 Tax=Knoellia altitudinis TaxID=3404795 RepID=UPI003606095D